MEHHSADSPVSPAPTLPRRGMPIAAGLPRFSPLTAPEREAIDAFCRDSRPWALRQARRTYQHLPESLREQAVDRAYTELRTRMPSSLERRALSTDLAERLTEALRHVHVGWCLNESSALLRREGTEPVQPEVRREDLAKFVDDGLGGLERAVLQLEVGAGRDTRTARAALRLNPRSYAQHRDAGFSKLRDAISAQVIGRACDQHVSSIVSAATGDRAAMDSLATGEHRCRYCAREAQGLRSVLHERLAVAPWPIVIKPAGLLAAKVGAVGALLGGKGSGTGVTAAALGSSGGSGASVAATVLAVAALATGTAALVGNDATPRERRAGHTAAAKQTTKRAKRASASTATAAKPGARKKAAKAERHSGARKHTSGGSTTAGTTAPATSAGSTVTSTGAGSGGSSGSVGGTVKPVTDAVKNTAETVTNTLPPSIGEPVQDTVDDVTNTVDDTTSTVDGLLP